MKDGIKVLTTALFIGLVAVMVSACGTNPLSNSRPTYYYYYAPEYDPLYNYPGAEDYLFDNTPQNPYLPHSAHPTYKMGPVAVDDSMIIIPDESLKVKINPVEIKAKLNSPKCHLLKTVLDNGKSAWILKPTPGESQPCARYFNYFESVKNSDTGTATSTSVHTSSHEGALQ